MDCACIECKQTSLAAPCLSIWDHWLQARVANNNKRLEDLERRMAQLLQEKRGLESQNKLLQHTVMVNTTHYTELQAQQVRYKPLRCQAIHEFKPSCG